jgi:ketosteroid isomerase-like protein
MRRAMRRTPPALAAALLLTIPNAATPPTRAARQTTMTNDPTQNGRPAAEARDVAEAERAFARRSVEIGWREAFLEFFDDDAISYAPDPGNAKERLRKRPPTPQPQKVILDWRPTTAGISASGDLGFTTGPSLGYENTPEKKAVYHGYYFSIWRRKPDGSWRVALDVGTETPPNTVALDALPFSVTPPGGWNRTRSAPDTAEELKRLLALERRVSAGLARANPSETYGRTARADARLHHDGHAPHVGRAAVVSHLAGVARRLSWRPAGGGVSKAADFGYTYGAYELTKQDAAVERGHYAHLWLRDSDGRWQLVADVMSPAPPEKK